MLAITEEKSFTFYLPMYTISLALFNPTDPISINQLFKLVNSGQVLVFFAIMAIIES